MCEPGAACCLSAGDTAWVLTSATLVFIQTPAMGVAQAGMIRRKNSLSMLLQTMSGMMIGSVLWFLIGFSLSYGDDVGGFIGNLDYSLLLNLPLDDCVPRFSRTLPVTAYVTFQMMFALMVPVIITGAWAEKLNFRGFLAFVTLWPLLCYYPIAHWVWGGGFLAELGLIDFGGGVTVHTNSGVASLVVSLIMRRRLVSRDFQTDHHNVPLTVVGGAFIIMGWYGFNGGSSLAANSIGSLAVLNTHLSMCVAGLTWGLFSYVSDRHFHLSEVINGAFAGMAGITPGAGFVAPGWSLVTGFVTGTGSYFCSWLLQNRVQLDDVLDVTSLQGVPGILGTLLTGLVASTSANPAGQDGLFYGHPEQFVYQLVGVACCIGWSGCWTAALVLFLEHTIGIHVSLEAQEAGLDASEVGESAYAQHGNIQESVYIPGAEEKALKALGTNPVAAEFRRR